MSWKKAGQLISGPPSSTLPSSSSSDLPIVKRLRPNSYSTTAHQRESNFASHYGYDQDSIALEEKSRKSDWDVVRENHRFVRNDEGGDGGGGGDRKDGSWEERVARAYESKLFKEFAMIDLKHYKSHQFALRWRTATEVINGLGENTCASLRCKYHTPPSPASSSSINTSDLRFKDPDTASSHISTVRDNQAAVGGKERVSMEEFEDEINHLRSFELPFVYAENGERKQALVKVRLCSGCQYKLRWKPKDQRNDDKKKKEKEGRKERSREKGKGKENDEDKDKEKYEDYRRDSKSRKRESPTSTSEDSDDDHHEKTRRYSTSKGKEKDKYRESKSHQRQRSRSRSPSRHTQSSRHHETPRRQR